MNFDHLIVGGVSDGSTHGVQIVGDDGEPIRFNDKPLTVWIHAPQSPALAHLYKAQNMMPKVDLSACNVLDDYMAKSAELEQRDLDTVSHIVAGWNLPSADGQPEVMEYSPAAFVAVMQNFATVWPHVKIAVLKRFSELGNSKAV